MGILETKNLTKYYGKARGIIDVSITIEKGEIYGFIGPNGAGKSTAIRTLLGFIKPTGGSAEIFGLDCFSRNDRIKAEIGYVPSEINYYDDMKVKDLLDYSAKFYDTDCTGRMKELCSIFEVETNKRIDSLSFGNKKKVSIVQALQHSPKLLFLDEPTGGLDPLMQNVFFDMLKEEKERGVTVFFSSHILSEVERMCDRVAIIKEGRILKVESIEKLHASKYKKVKLEYADDENRLDLDLPGVANVSLKGKFTEFVYSGSMDALTAKLAQRKLNNLWIEELSLEEIFMHYYEKGEK